ncbi:YdcF family protein [Cyanobacteria bacterium FACHB-63]|nr:YdcF family protein [Cyanobacteria bacterium FACHB-63]
MSKKSRFFWGITAALTLCSVSYIPANLVLARQQASQPERILVLGGGSDREQFAAQLAQAHPQVDLWVSSGSPNAAEILRSAGLPPTRFHIDHRASDTVTNFTSVADDFKRQQIQSVYVVTSDFHRARAEAIATLVFGSRGIAFTVLTVPSDRPPETSLHIARDVARSLLWLSTGRTGASFKYSD